MTKTNECVNITKLSLIKRQQRKEHWKLNSEKPWKILMNLFKQILKIWRTTNQKIGSFKTVDFSETENLTSAMTNLNMRVWSWLRMNAGGVLNTCKSNEAHIYDPFGVTNMWLSGGRVSNAWVTCLIQGDNSWKRLLIPHKRTVPHGTVWKTPVVWDGPALD